MTQKRIQLDRCCVARTLARAAAVAFGALWLGIAVAGAQSVDKHRPAPAHHPTIAVAPKAHINAGVPAGAVPVRKVTAVPGQPNHHSVGSAAQKSSLNPQPIPPGHGTSAGPKSKSSVSGTSVKHTTSKSPVKR